MAERIRDLQRERHEARQHPPLYGRGEEEQQPGPGAVAHHRLPRKGTLSGREEKWEHMVFSNVTQLFLMTELPILT